MKAYDIAGKRSAASIQQIPLAKRLGWAQETLRDIERGFVDITEEQHRAIHNAIDVMKLEAQAKGKAEAISA